MRNEKMVAEAVTRMEMLEIMENPINEFKEEGKLNLSETIFVPGILYWTENYKGLNEKIKEFEDRSNCLVYHVILNHTNIGDMYAMLYVSPDEEEWDMDKEDLENGMAYANVWNGDIEEIGSIGVRPANGGVQRTW